MRRAPYLHQSKQQGFSLIQMSAIVAVAAILMVAMLPGGDAGSDNEKIKLTKQRMQAIESAMQSFMAGNLRRPCPASLSATTESSNFGIEQITGGTCTSLIGTTEYVGMVPVKALNLPDEYAFDGYGRRLEYRVDQRATVAGSAELTDTVSSCYDMQTQGQKGAIEILDAATDTVGSDTVMWALLSHGKDKYGSYAAQGGSALADTSGDANTALNIGTTGQLVRKEPTSTFDDIVWYAENTKNTCCLGKNCTLGFNTALEGDAATADSATGANTAVGDINGDGIKDLIIGATSRGSGAVFVVFGNKIGWPVRQSLNLNEIAPDGDGTYGFVVNNNSNLANFGRTVAAGDVNGDSYDDIVISGATTDASLPVVITVIFGKATYSSDEILTSALDGTNGMMITNNVAAAGTPTKGGAVAVGDLDGDGIKEIIFAQATYSTASANRIWVVWGRSDLAALGTPTTIGDAAGTPTAYSTASMAGTEGFRIVGKTTTYPVAQSAFSLAVGNVNGDVYEDLLIGAHTVSSNLGYAYLIFGRTRAALVADVTAGPPATVTLDITADTGWLICNNTAPCRGLMFKYTGRSKLGNSVALADLGNDGYSDIIISDSGYVYAYNGRAGGGPAANGSWTNTTNGSPFVDFSSISPSFTINATTDLPSGWITSTPSPNVVKAADINNDGKKDLLMGFAFSAAPTACGKGANTGSVYVLMQPNGTPQNGWASGNLFVAESNTATCDADELNTASYPGSFRIDGLGTKDYAYNPIAADLNQDGKNDIFIAAPGDTSDVSAPHGTIYALYGRKTVAWEPVVDLAEFNNFTDAPALALTGYGGGGVSGPGGKGGIGSAGGSF